MNVQILTGDCRTTLATLPSESVHCVTTSPPYWGLRSYLPSDHESKSLEIGGEPTYQQYVENMVAVFREVRRVLRSDGVLWLNLGDCYATGAGKACSPGGGKQGEAWQGPKGYEGRMPQVPDAKNPNAGVPVFQPNRMPQDGLKPKDLAGIPWRVAFALQADGWYLRAACPWIKRNGMPESTTDRPTTVVETIFMLTKGQSYFYDGEAVKKPATEQTISRISQPGLLEQNGSERANAGGKTNGNMKAVGGSLRSRRSSDWFLESWQGMLQDEDGLPTAFVVNTASFTEAHFAVFPKKLIEPCILSSTSSRGCCPACGSPWERIMDEGEPDIEHQRACGGDTNGEYHGEAMKDYGANGAQNASATKARILAGMKRRKTIDWTPLCKCGREDTLPCAVLDPFGGSGTSAEVATEHGRRGIVCELNEEYVPLIEARTASPGLAF